MVWNQTAYSTLTGTRMLLADFFRFGRRNHGFLSDAFHKIQRILPSVWP